MCAFTQKHKKRGWQNFVNLKQKEVGIEVDGVECQPEFRGLSKSSTLTFQMKHN